MGDVNFQISPLLPFRLGITIANAVGGNIRVRRDGVTWAAITVSQQLVSSCCVRPPEYPSSLPRPATSMEASQELDCHRHELSNGPAGSNRPDVPARAMNRKNAACRHRCREKIDGFQTSPASLWQSSHDLQITFRVNADFQPAFSLLARSTWKQALLERTCRVDRPYIYARTLLYKSDSHTPAHQLTPCTRASGSIRTTEPQTSTTPRGIMPHR